MDDKELEKLQNELMQLIDKESELEKNIIESSKEIAQNLLSSNKKRCRAIIDNREFMLSYVPYQNKETRMICILSVNVLNFKMSLGNYKPAKIEAEYDSDYTEKENLERVIESYIRHISGLIQPEEIEN